MNQIELFAIATRKAWRFPSIKGEITTEQLWQLSLQSRDGFDLDTVAKTVNASLRATTEDSFVSTTANPAKAKFEQMLELIKYVISVKLAEAEAEKNKAARKAERNKLLEVLEKKQDAAYEGMDADQIRARIRELGVE